MEAELADRGTPGFSGELPLSEAQAGWVVGIASYRSNGRQAQRLAELGLTPGTVVRILRSGRGQPLLICVRGTHLGIDYETAGSLNVHLLERRGRARRRQRGWRGRRHRNCDG